MSAAPGTEALDEPLDDPTADAPRAGSAPVERLAVRHARPTAPGRPVAAAAPRPQGRSGLRAWVQALRLDALPALLLGAALAGLLLLVEPTAQLLPAALAAGGLVVAGLVTAVLRALGDPDRRRAGPLRRVEAGRALLGLLLVAVVVTGALVAVRGWAALLLAAAALAAAVAGVRWSGRDLTVPATALGAPALWWAATGGLPWRVVLVGAVAGALVAALRSTASSRVLVAAPCAVVGLAVALHALPWPALLVAAVLPAARHAAVAGRPAAAPARLALVLLVAGLVVAVTTGADLPLTAPR